MAPPDRLAFGLASAALPLRVLLALRTDLSPDEAYYLAASRLQLSIADHPPLTPWLAGVADTVTFLPLELRIRLPALILGTGFSWLVIELVRRRGGSAGAQRWAAAFGAWFALPLAGGFLLTPDVTLLTVLIALVLLVEVAPRARAPRVLGIALLCFIGMLAKVVMAAAVLALLLSSKRWTDRVAAIAGLTCALPLAASSLRFQFNHAFVDQHAFIGAVGAVAAALGAQFALWSPAALWYGAQRVVDHRLDRNFVGLMFTLVIASAALRGVAPEANWFAPAAVLLAVAASHAMPRAARWLRVTTLILGPAMSMLVATHVIHPWIPIAGSLDPTARLHGWSRGKGTVDAAGVGPYGPAAEACVYRNECKLFITNSTP